jgi:hypothetical protein
MVAGYDSRGCDHYVLLVCFPQPLASPNRSTDLHHSFCVRRRMLWDRSAIEIFTSHSLGGENFENSKNLTKFSIVVSEPVADFRNLSRYSKSDKNRSSTMMLVHSSVYRMSLSPWISCPRVLLLGEISKYSPSCNSVVYQPIYMKFWYANSESTDQSSFVLKLE